MSVNKFVGLSSFLLSNFVLITFVSKTISLFPLICVLIVSPFISWFIANAIYFKVSSKNVSTSNRAILITGCDTGFGHQLAIECDKLGFSVFAGVLNPDRNGAQHLTSICSQRLQVLKMDVTNAEEVTNVINQIKGSGLQLWALVNNAGIAISAPIEWGNDVQQLNDTFAVNVLGAVRVTKQALPLLRQSMGRVINMSSLSGRAAFDGIAYYSMSKFAIRSFSDGLRIEMAYFGIKVITIEPVLYRTPIIDLTHMKDNLDNVWHQTGDDVKHVYSDNFRRKYETKTRQVIQSSRKNIKEVIDVMIKAIVLERPQYNYKCGGIIDYLITYPMSYLPQLLQDYINQIIFRNSLLLTFYQKLSL